MVVLDEAVVPKPKGLLGVVCAPVHIQFAVVHGRQAVPPHFLLEDAVAQEVAGLLQEEDVAGLAVPEPEVDGLVDLLVGYFIEGEHLGAVSPVPQADPAGHVVGQDVLPRGRHPAHPVHECAHPAGVPDPAGLPAQQEELAVREELQAEGRRRYELHVYGLSYSQVMQQQ